MTRTPQFQATVIARSVGVGDKDIVTMSLTYPRFIHSELKTHRQLSGSSMSSRAVPVKKMLTQAWSDPAMPVHWGANQAGMQASAQLEGWRLWVAKALWKLGAKLACGVAWGMDKVGLHKQVANRVLEPYQLMRTVVTGTEWTNFYNLRCHPDAQPEFQKLAVMMREAHKDAPANYLPTGSWHLPYVTEAELTKHGAMVAARLSAARCARVSYLTHDGKSPSVEADLKLFDRLAGSVPMHASPLEHQATPGGVGELQGNLRQWTQFRKVWEAQNNVRV